MVNGVVPIEGHRERESELEKERGEKEREREREGERGRGGGRERERGTGVPGMISATMVSGAVTICRPAITRRSETTRRIQVAASLLASCVQERVREGLRRGFSDFPR